MSLLSILFCRLKDKVHSPIYSWIQQIICWVSTMCQELNILGPGNIAMNKSNNNNKKELSPWILNSTLRDSQ